MRILFCTTPNISIFKKSIGLELSLGASEMVGGLVSSGNEVSYYDLNLKLNKIRSHNTFSEEKARKFIEPNQFLESFNKNEFRDQEVLSWVRLLVESIEVEDFDLIALSMDRMGNSMAISRANFHFSLLLAKGLSENYSVPIVLGGKLVYRNLGKNYYEGIVSGLSKSPVDVFWTVDGKYTFPSTLESLVNSFDGNDRQSRVVDQFPKGSENINLWNLNLESRFQIKNEEDLKVCGSDVFPDHIVSQYPELAEIDSFFLAPFRFSQGCPFSCAFCQTGPVKSFFSAKPREIAEALRDRVLDGARFFRLFNSNVNYSKKFVLELCDEIKKLNLDILFSDSANLTHINREIAEGLRGAGCVKLWYGAETLSDKMLQLIEKGIDREKMLQSLSIMAEAGIWNSCNFIHSFPHETTEDFDHLLRFIEHSSLMDTCQVNTFELLAKTNFSLLPQKYGIEIIGATENGGIFSFNEVGGRGWQQRCAEASQRMEQVYNVFPYELQFLTASDTHFFPLKALGISNKRIKDILYSLYDYLANEGELKSYIDLFNSSLPKGYDVPVFENEFVNISPSVKYSS